MWLGLVCLMGLAGCCLSLDYYDHQATIEVQKMKEEREEFKRFWEEVVKSNPSELAAHPPRLQYGGPDGVLLEITS